MIDFLDIGQTAGRWAPLATLSGIDILDDHDRVLARLPIVAGAYVEARANARLMAAAPVLLDALFQILPLARDVTDPRYLIALKALQIAGALETDDNDE